MRLALFHKLSKAEQKKETAKAIVRIQNAYKELCNLGVWHNLPKGFPKKVNSFILWERKDLSPTL